MRPDRQDPGRRSGFRSRLRTIVNLASFAALVGLLLVTWPQSLGGLVAYIKVSGHSMEPTMHLGDLVVIRSESQYHLGEVIAYRVPPGEVGAGVTVIHRIVGGGVRAGFVTRGDHNHYDDPWRPRPAQIVGARWARLPGAANLFSRVRGPLPLAAFAALLTMLTVAELLKPRRRRPSTTAPELTDDERAAGFDDQRLMALGPERALVETGVRSE
jgi:signal peptidase